jgi:hypothetical protein
MPFGFRCHNLIINGYVGEPDASHCGCYSQRYEGMPILLFDDEGNIRGESVCHVGAADDQGLIDEYIGHGCALEVDNG